MSANPSKCQFTTNLSNDWSKVAVCTTGLGSALAFTLVLPVTEPRSPLQSGNPLSRRNYRVNYSFLSH